MGQFCCSPFLVVVEGGGGGVGVVGYIHWYLKLAVAVRGVCVSVSVVDYDDDLRGTHNLSVLAAPQLVKYARRHSKKAKFIYTIVFPIVLIDKIRHKHRK